MGIHGIHMLTADEALNIQLGALGYDEVDFTEHLTNGATVASSEWGVVNDLKTADGAVSLTVSDTTDSTLANFFTGELLDALQILTPVANRVMTDNQNQWTSHDLTTFSDAGSWLRTDANDAGMYFKLATQYAPMTAGEEYKMVVKTNAQTWQGTGWYVQDYGGRALFSVLSDPGTSGQEETFTAPDGTSGGFRFVAISSNTDVFYWDNFTLVNTAADAVAIGLVFKVGGTGDTTDNALAAAKGSAVANNDLFVVTSITGTGEVVYIGNAIGSYAWSSNQRSTLLQTLSDRASAGLNSKGRNSKDYRLSYTIATISQVSKNINTCTNGDYGTFDGASATGFHAISSGAATHEGGTADEISVVSGQVYEVSFTLALTSGTAPTIGMLDALNGSTLATETSQTSIPGSNVITFTASSTGTGVIQFQNTSTATEYTVSSLDVYLVSHVPDGDFALTLEQFGGDTEIIASASDRAFVSPNNWANVNVDAYDEDGDLTITADTIGQYCTLPVAKAPMTAEKFYELTFDVANLTSTWTVRDFTGTQTFGTISAEGTSQTINFRMESGLTGGFRIVAVGATSSMDFDNASLKEIDSKGNAVNATITLPHSSGAQVVYFKSNHNASTSPFTIVGTSTTATKGVLGISSISLFRCCDNAKNPDGVSWWKIRAFQDTATFSATSINGDDLSSDALTEHNTIEGAWSRIIGTAGIILAYRVPYRSSDT